MNRVFADTWFFLTGDKHFEQAGFKALLR